MNWWWLLYLSVHRVRRAISLPLSFYRCSFFFTLSFHFYCQRQYHVMSAEFVWNEIEIDMNLLNAIFFTHISTKFGRFFLCANRAFSVVIFFCSLMLVRFVVRYYECYGCDISRLLFQSLRKTHTQKNNTQKCLYIHIFFLFSRWFHRKRLEMMRMRAHVAVINSFKYSPKNLFDIRELVNSSEI